MKATTLTLSLFFLTLPTISYHARAVDFTYGPVKNFEVPPAMKKGLKPTKKLCGIDYPHDHDTLQATIWLAEKGYAEANYILGMMYIDKRLPQKDINAKKGISFIQKAIDIEPEYGNALYVLANAYNYGEGVEKDVAKSLELYERAGKAGVPEGYRNIAVEYSSGRNMPIDLTKSKYFIDKAANLGDPQALVVSLDWEAYSKTINPKKHN